MRGGWEKVKILILVTKAVEMPPGHIDEVLGVMNQSALWNFDKTPVHVIDRAADSVGHYRQWHAAGHRFVVRADDNRLVLFDSVEQKRSDVVGRLNAQFNDVLNSQGERISVTIRESTRWLRVVVVVLHWPVQHHLGYRSRQRVSHSLHFTEPVRSVHTHAAAELSRVAVEFCVQLV